jgi:methionyl-tRNA formyltransferase
MKIVVLTQEDAFYIPRILDLLLAERHDVTLVAIVPGELQPGHVQRYLRLMGVRDFVLQSANLVLHRVLDVLGRVIRVGPSRSVVGAANRAGVRHEHVPKVNAPAFAQRLRDEGVDLIVSVACPQKLGRELLAVPAHGAINLHGALLPRYQGMLPSFWVLAKGECETGVTVHWMDDSIDTGDVLLQKTMPIEPGDTVHSLVLRSKVEVGRHLLVQAIARIERGDAPRMPMDAAQASRFSFPDDAARDEFRRRGRRFI